MKKIKLVLIISAASLLSAGSLGCGSSNPAMIAPVTGTPAVNYTLPGALSCPAGTVAANGACTGASTLQSACAQAGGVLIAPSNTICRVNNGTVNLSVSCSAGTFSHCTVNSPGGSVYNLVSSPITTIGIGQVFAGDTLVITATGSTLANLSLINAGQTILAAGASSAALLATGTGQLTALWTGTIANENFSISATDSHCSDVNNTASLCP